MTAPGFAWLREGDVLAGRYVIGAELGRGGFSVVYRAEDRTLRTQVAVKLLVPPPAAAALAKERMRREVQAVRGITHENIVAVHDFLEDNDRCFVVMEYVAGPDLARLIATQKRPMSADETVRLGQDISAGLAMAHRHGVIHRDVKPQNILIGADGRARLTDFGSARLDGMTGVTRTGGLVGTVDYMAPELLAGARGDGRADLYALGLTLHFAIAGRLPDRSQARAPLEAKADGHHPARVSGGPRIPAWLDQVIARATAAAPERRFPSAIALADALAMGPGTPARPALAEPPPPACALCGDADPFGLGLCVRCGGTSPHAADRAVLVQVPAGREAQEAVRVAVHELLGNGINAELANSAARGERVLLNVPASSTGTVLAHLAERGVPARAVLSSKVWQVLPPRFYGLLIVMTFVGLVAGQIEPVLMSITPLAAVAWWFMGFREIRRPALVATGLSSRFPAEAEREVVAALTELPAGSPRQLLADIARVARRLAEQVSGTDRESIGQVLTSAAKAARELSGLEESMESFERLDETEPKSPATGAHDALARGRDRLVQELLDVLTALGRAQGRVAQTGGATDGMVELANVLEGSLVANAEARREVERYLTGAAA